MPRRCGAGAAAPAPRAGGRSAQPETRAGRGARRPRPQPGARRPALPRARRGGARTLACLGRPAGCPAAAGDHPAEHHDFAGGPGRPGAGPARAAAGRAGLGDQGRHPPGAGRLRGGDRRLRPARGSHPGAGAGHLHRIFHGADRPRAARAARRGAVAGRECGRGVPHAGRGAVGADAGGRDRRTPGRPAGRGVVCPRPGGRPARPLPAGRLVRLAARPPAARRGRGIAGRLYARRSAAAAPGTGRAGAA